MQALKQATSHNRWFQINTSASWAIACVGVTVMTFIRDDGWWVHVLLRQYNHWSTALIGSHISQGCSCLHRNRCMCTPSQYRASFHTCSILTTCTKQGERQDFYCTMLENDHYLYGGRCVWVLINNNDSIVSSPGDSWLSLPSAQGLKQELPVLWHFHTPPKQLREIKFIYLFNQTWFVAAQFINFSSNTTKFYPVPATQLWGFAIFCLIG